MWEYFNMEDGQRNVRWIANNHTKKRREQRKKQKDKMTYGQGYENMIAVLQMNALAHQGQSANKAPVKKETNMYVDYVSNDKHSESAKTNYLLSRYTDVKCDIDNALQKQFGLRNDEKPYTAKDLVSRIQSGKFILPTETEEQLIRNQYYGGASAIDTIKWRDPAIVEDKAGYEVAEKQLKAAGQEVHDSIMIDTNDNALAAIKVFQTWTPTSTTVKAS